MNDQTHPPAPADSAALDSQPEVPSPDAASTGAPADDPLAKLGKGVVLVAFAAPWCTPFLLTDTVLQEIEAEGGDVRRVDIEDWPQHAESFRVVSLPTFVSVRSGTEKERTIGAVTRPDLFRLAGLKRPKR